MSGVRFICLIAVPRTGGTHTLKLLRNCKQLNIKGALFHRTSIDNFAKEDWAAMSAASGGVVKDDASLCAWRAEHAALTLETLYKSGGKRTLVMKIAPDQLDPARIESDILERDDVRYMVLRRRPIESFISGRKAKITGSYGKVDTTGIAPSVKAKEFLDWAQRTKGFYDWFEAALQARGHAAAQLVYERDLDEVSNETALAGIVGKLQAIGVRDLALPPVIKAAGQRQDREPDYRKRVSNWPEFEASLSARPADAKLLEWARASAE